MNKLEKLFNNIESSPRTRKARCVEDCIIQLREYVFDFSAYILRRVNTLLTSLATEDRRAGYAILKSLDNYFQLDIDLREIQVKKDSEYYSSAASFVESNRNIKSQKAYIKQKFNLDIKNLVMETDFEIEKSKINVVKRDIDIKIENVYDFFTVIEYNLLSSEWHKRHGSFLGYIALLESRLQGKPSGCWEKPKGFFGDNEGDIATVEGDYIAEKRQKETNKIAHVKIAPHLVSIALEILHEDKFSDFVNDQTTSPVREAASYLLSLIYPTYTFKDHLVCFLISFLEEDDWQVQFSALVAFKYLKNDVEVPTFIVKCLRSNDEDVKYLAASILSHYVEKRADKEQKFLKNVIKKTDKDLEESLSSPGGQEKEGGASISYDEILVAALEAIQASDGISLSYASLLNLVYQLNPVEIQDSMIWSCFRYPIKAVRKMILNCLGLLKDRKKILLKLALNILVEEDQDILALSQERFRKYYETEDSLDLVRILARREIFYDRRDFGDAHDDENDDLYFNMSGAKTLGRERMWEGRCSLFRLMTRVEGRADMRTSVMGMCFAVLFNIWAKGCENLDSCENTRLETRLKEVLLPLEGELKPFRKELKKMESPEYASIHPRSIEIFTDLQKLKACLELEVGVVGVSMYQVLSERSSFSSLACFLLLKLGLCNDSVIKHMYKIGNNVFFKELGSKLTDYRIYEDIKAEKNLGLFCNIVEYLDPATSEWAFYEAISSFDCYERETPAEKAEVALKTFVSGGRKKKKGAVSDAEALLKKHNIEDGTNTAAPRNPCVKIVTHFIRDLRYNEVFVRKMLEDFDVRFLNECMRVSEPSLNALFVKPVLKCINRNIFRSVAAECFGKIVPTLTIEVRPDISPELRSLTEHEKKDVEELYTFECKEYAIECPMSVSLRPYQAEGVNWLYFLMRFQLNGILGDDMGLGKTIQVLTLVCSEMYKSRSSRAVSESVPESAPPRKARRRGAKRPAQKEATALSKKRAVAGEKRVLVICPSSIMGHWKAEIEKYFPFVTCEIYSKKGLSAEILIVSYDAYRNDYKSFGRCWFYLILDEGHVVRNKDTLLYSRVQLLEAEHKIILSGTPVQNEAQDLVNLFNILMPGYLQIDELKVLHKRVLPFVLRRLKSDVLSELPDKIIRDVTVEMDSSQREIYIAECEKGHADAEEDTSATTFEGVEGLEKTQSSLGYGKVNKRSSNFTRIQKLLKVCSSFKLGALSDLLVLMGGNDMKSKGLVFCQFKATIDVVSRHLDEKFPQLAYLRLDGSVVPKNRQKIVTDFNTLNYNLLLLTTSIGGLGLNLTSADTVIFYEHDWNPFNDLQAMDRAHRLGQEKTVNVFRIVLKDTIEEKVMSYQNFKMYLANTIVNYENKEVSQMDLKDTLERFREGETVENEDFDSEPLPY